MSKSHDDWMKFNLYTCICETLHDKIKKIYSIICIYQTQKHKHKKRIHNSNFKIIPKL